MKCSRRGEFYGRTNDTVVLDGISLNDADYVHEKVDWHYHENAYFTLLLRGGMIEGNRKEVYECSSGSLLFHHWQDPHYNICSKQNTRGFHIELTPDWFKKMDLNSGPAGGSSRIVDPKLKLLMYSILRETKLERPAKQINIDALLLGFFGLMAGTIKTESQRKPAWVGKVRDVLHTNHEGWTLIGLATLANVHPVHLSREFPKYFQASLGDYVRSIKLQKALALMNNKNLSLTEISAEAGFADQSHFIRAFKSSQQITPLQFRKLLIGNAKG